MNTNENQNLNSVVPPTTDSGLSPNVPPVNTGVPSPSEVNMGISPNVGAPVPPVTPNVSGPAPTVAPPTAPVPPAPEVNLHPEGTVVETPPVEQPTVAEPLMGTTLNSQTVLNPSSAPGMAPMGANPNPMSPPPMGTGPVPPINNNMGMMGGIPTPPTMPPAKEEKPKKKFNPMLIVLIVVLIAGVGFAVYYFLNASKPSTQAVRITPLLSEVELGSEVDNDASNYANVTGYDIKNCTVDTDLNVTKTGTYQYTITCGTNKSGPNTVTVSDTTAPVVVLKDLIILPDDAVTVDDFIESVSDFSDYTIEFEEEVDTSTTGTYDVTVVVTDDFENETKATAKLTIDENAPDYYLSCLEEDEESEEYNAVITKNYRYGINLSGEFYNAVKRVTYQFNEEDYLIAKEDATDTEFDGIKGTVITNDSEFTITISIPLELEDLAKEYDLDEFPTMDVDIENFYLDKDNTCEIN